MRGHRTLWVSTTGAGAFPNGGAYRPRPSRSPHRRLLLANEVTRELPDWAAGRTFTEGEPILTAFECALLERETESGFIYTMVNLRSGRTAVLSRRATPLKTSEVNAMVARMRNSTVAGASRVQADRAVGKPLTYAQAVAILHTIFREILPKYGFAVREEQLTLAEHILDTLARRNTTLAESEVGTGKTLAYLVPAVIVKRGRLNDERNISLYPEMQYADRTRMPVVLATSSIALQRAILTEYIPDLSRILLESGVIITPLTAVLRKGREHYVCRHRLLAELRHAHVSAMRQTLERLLRPDAEIDLAEVSGIDARTRKHICVPTRCLDTCKYRENCAYLEFREQAQSYNSDFQVCNHNYLLADSLRRADGNAGLIPNYQALVIDEAHKFVSGAARTMYGSEMLCKSAADVLTEVGRTDFKTAGYEKAARRAAKKLSDASAKLFAHLTANAKRLSDEDGEEHFAATIDDTAAQYIRNIGRISEQLFLLLRDEAVRVKALELLSWVRKKYKVATDDIDLKHILYADPKAETTREEQEKRVAAQVTQLHRAICNIPRIKQIADTEREQRSARQFTMNPERYAIAYDKSTVSDTIWQQTRNLCCLGGAYGEASEYLVALMWKLQMLRDQAEAFANPDALICSLETDNLGQKLCAIPKDIGARLCADRWSKGIPTVLTSGTLSASGDFTRTKQTTGLARLGVKVTEICTPSPFNYRENALLYVSQAMPFPNPDSPAYYINSVADEIARLVKIANGHAAVLFTSYGVMGRVHAELHKRRLPFPMFKLEKSTSSAIERFKASGNGVLLASGSLWEGIDIPGDALSLLIIVKLPFSPPDAQSEYEREQCGDSKQYLNDILVPDMLIKLKQGFGRLIRTETDTGVVAILDCRANEHGNYHERVLTALPDCRVTSDIGDVETFLRSKKPLGYW